MVRNKVSNFLSQQFRRNIEKNLCMALARMDTEFFDAHTPIELNDLTYVGEELGEADSRLQTTISRVITVISRGHYLWRMHPALGAVTTCTVPVPAARWGLGGQCPCPNPPPKSCECHELGHPFTNPPPPPAQVQPCQARASGLPSFLFPPLPPSRGETVTSLFCGAISIAVVCVPHLPHTRSGIAFP